MTTTTGGSAGDREVLIGTLSELGITGHWAGVIADAILAAGFGRGHAWIACSERMPEPDIYVRTSGKCHGTLLTAAWDKERDGWFSYDGQVCECAAITHWKPLDAPPQPDTTDKPSGSHEGTVMQKPLDETDPGVQVYVARQGGGGHNYDVSCRYSPPWSPTEQQTGRDGGGE